jgi:hypothetical protein
MQLNIMLPDGTTEGIVLLPATASRVTLGVSTLPDGNDAHHLNAPGKANDKWKSIATRARVWLNRLKIGISHPNSRGYRIGFNFGMV